MFNTIFPKIHKEGYKFLAISIIATFVVLFFSKLIGFILIIVTVWVYYFFRDPERYSINDESYLVSPADGLITDVSERSGPEELRLENTTYTRVSIFMNVFNCHVNRIPTNGKIEEIYYKPGKFLNASLDKASEENERNYFKIKDEENEKLLIDILNKKFHPDIFYLLSIVNKKKIDNKLISTAEKQLEEYDKKYENKLDRFWYVHPLYFGLAIFYNKIDQSKSENFYELANQEIITSLRYNSFEYQNDIINIMNCYKDNFSHLSLENDSEGETNFFILGTPRSGTTLIESFIASNNDVTSAGELLSARNLIADFVADVRNQSTEEFIINFRKTYLSRTKYLKGEYKNIVDKLPDNFLFIGFLYKLLPKTKIIRTFRDPWDVAVSLFKQRYVTNIPYSASFFNIGVFMANFEAINIYWDEILDKKNALLDIKYEDLVEDPENYQKKIERRYFYKNIRGI